jgi:hypothetical protein
MKLEVGMYVRTKEFGIQKVKWFDNEEPILENGFTALQKDFKASHNIIDLIEVGDFITLGENNYPVQIRNLWEHGGDIHIELSNGAKIEDLHCNKDFKIYSIVTKEQFESMSYKVN